MPSDDPTAASETAPVPRSRGVRAVLRRWRRQLRGRPKPTPSETASALAAAAAVAASGPGDIVDQAEVFKTLRVSDVMTPRADIMAIEISTPFESVVRQFAEVEHSR